jgi:hypothetical protein
VTALLTAVALPNLVVWIAILLVYLSEPIDRGPSREGSRFRLIAELVGLVEVGIAAAESDDPCNASDNRR